MSKLIDVSSANRLHIGFFGKTNSGKSSIINKLTRQELSIVSEKAGTTTDPVIKAIEIHPLGPCVVIDTAGFGDDTELGKLREEKTKQVSHKVDIAVIVVAADQNPEELEKDIFPIYQEFKATGTPVLFIVNKSDVDEETARNYSQIISDRTQEEAVITSALSDFSIDIIREKLARLVPKDFGVDEITGALASREDIIMLVMPQDIQAPKGRLILPQVQTLRELLDKKCIVICVTTDEMTVALDSMKKPPKLIITDSQVFDYVYQNKPEESLLTSFSVLMAAYKGDLDYFVDSAKAISGLNNDSKVLIAECCTHAPLSEDIGTVKIPRMLRKKYGEAMTIDHVSGTDFPRELKDYDLIIHCGGCMFNRKYVMSRVERAKSQKVAMTNYGVALAFMMGILDKIESTKK